MLHYVLENYTRRLSRLGCGEDDKRKWKIKMALNRKSKKRANISKDDLSDSILLTKGSKGFSAIVLVINFFSFFEIVGCVSGES